MLKKTMVLVFAIGIILSLCMLTTFAAEAPSDKSAYFKDDAAVNCTPSEFGNNITTVVSGDVLKILITGKSDPSVDIRFPDNVDTKTYKILALKVKKEYAAAIGGEVFYNEKGAAAVGGKSVTFSYAEGTDYQWVYVDLSGKTEKVGYLRYDVYGESPVENTLVRLAYIGFFKSVDDLNAYKDSTEGKALGAKEGNRAFPIDVAFAGTDRGVGVWLNSPTDTEKPGYYWIKFNANAPFYAINYYLYASKNNVKGHWALYKYNHNIDATLAGTPVAKQNLDLSADSALKADFPQMQPGQYVFYIELDPGQTNEHYFVSCVTTKVPDSKYIEIGYNGRPNVADSTYYMSGTVRFETTDVQNYFKELVADTEVPETENPKTGDVALIGYGIATLASVLIKKRKVR